MTLNREQNPPPERISIRCPRCGDQAVFAFGRHAYVDDRPTRVALGKRASCQTFTTTLEGEKRHVVVFHALLAPEGEAPPFEGTSLAKVGWDRDGTRPRKHEGMTLGAFACGVCLTTKAHALTWPSDAFYVCAVQGQTLWTWTRDECLALRDFVAATDDGRAMMPERLGLRQLPPDLLEGSGRDELVKRLDALLDAGAF